jgi:hypothetical protein
MILAALGALATGAAHATGLERLYILNCGEGVAGDISRWSPGVNVGQSMPFVDNCYLLKHTQGWLLWDTGVPDAIAAMPDGQKPADPKATHWYRPQTLASQLEALGVKPADITFVAVSHTHGDHIGNVELFPQAMLLVQKAEYDWPGANNAPRFNPEHPVTKLDGDKDVFGDGSVTILATPGIPLAISRCWSSCRRRARSCCPATRCISRPTGTIAGCPPTTSTRSRPRRRWSASPESSRRKRRRSGSTMTRRSATP